MSDILIRKDAKIVKVIAAQARGERIESDVANEAGQIIQELLADFNPQNRYQIGQLMAYSLTEMQQGANDWLAMIADQKNINFGDKAAFNVRMSGIKAYIQAKGATTSRSKVADRQLIVDTIAVSARPALNIVELRAGRKNMSDLIREANLEINNTKLGHIMSVLAAAADDYTTPYYATGVGFVPATFDPMLTHWRRAGGVSIIGDIAALDKLALATGFSYNAAGDKQFADGIIENYHRTGMIGNYKGAPVVAMPNPYLDGGTETLIDKGYLYLMPVGLSADARNLKVVNEGPVTAFEAQNIDDLVYEVRLDQWFGAAFVVGKNPSLGVYLDSAL